MKNILKLTLVVVAVLCSTNVFAQKLARVNSQEIFAVMPEVKEMEQQLDAFAKELQEQLEIMQVDINNFYMEYEKTQATMNPTVKQMKQAELNDKQQRYAQSQQIAQQDFTKKQQELQAPIQDKLNAAIAKVAKAAGYTAVFDSMLFVYYDEAQVVNIDAAVKKELGIVAQ
jgi:outer membrane protein